MAINGSNSPDHMVKAASVCDKYCSKTAALTTFNYDNEEANCGICVHWNGKPCILYEEMRGRADGDAGS
jgi:hypothetical protein